MAPAVTDIPENSVPMTLAKKKPGNLGQPVQIETNLKELVLRPNTAYFKYDLRAYAIYQKKDGKECLKELTKQTRQDFTEQTRKTACADIFNSLVKTSPLFRGDLIYDRAAILFSMTQLKGVTDEATVLFVEMKHLMKSTLDELGSDVLRVEVHLKKAADSFQCTTGDLRTACNAEFKGSDRALFEVMNLATSQAMFFQIDKFVTYGNGNIYFYETPKEIPVGPIGNDKYVGVGLSKGVRIAEGDNSTPENPGYTPMIAIELKKTPFHNDDQPLCDKIRSMFDREFNSRNFFQTCHYRLEKELNGLQVTTTYGKKRRTITIGGITKTSVKEITFKDASGKIIRMADYFNSKYNVQVDPNFPCVVDKFDKNIKIPMSLLTVAKSQRVKKDQGGPTLSEKIIRQSAVLPIDRQKQTAVVGSELGLSSDKMKKFGITAKDDAPVKVNGRQMPPPKVGYSSGPVQGASWTSGKYLVPMSDAKWALITTDRQIPASFIDAMKRTGSGLGLKIADPVYGATDVTDQDIRKHAEAAKQRGARLLVLLSNHSNDHALLKEVEVEVDIVTQEIKLSSLGKGPMTLQNICHKFNGKLGGVNLNITANDKDAQELLRKSLIIGLVVRHPEAIPAKDREARKRPQQPAIIAWGSNGGKLGNGTKIPDAQSTNFPGNFRFANPREVDYNGDTQNISLKNCIVDILKQFKDNRGAVPMQVIVFRGGVSEGEFLHVAAKEKDVFLAAFATLNEKYKPGLSIIAVTKDHNDRFYRAVKKEGRAKEQNLPPGCVIDTKIVNPEFTEFYLQSHAALQGTAKASKYVLLHEPNKFGMNTYQDLTNSLTHTHQIVCSTTAIPTPLYVAEECAKRAAEQFQHKRYDLFPNGDIDLDVLNKTLAYGPDSEIRGIRFNA